MSTANKKVMVVGGGIAGLTAAWELSQLDIDVELIEKTCFLGGYAIQFCCKATDECVACGACSVEDMLYNVVNEPKIKVHLAAEVKKINTNGKLSVSLKKSSPPTDLPDGGLVKGYSKNNSPLFVVVDKSSCKDIPDGAIEFKDIKLTNKIDDIDAVILASGFNPFNAERKGTYGYHKFNNVVTGLDLEYIVRKNGALVRPSDGKEPQAVAFIQCVGSRDENLGNLWCSQVCCPYALRMAEQTKYKKPDTDITIFYMDIQNVGKNFPVFYEKCKSDMRFVRNIPVDLYPIKGDKLQMRYMNDDGLSVKEVFDMVVLSIGIMPGSDNAQLSELLDINLNQDGFFACKDKFNRTSTSKDGIFIAGTVQGPKTIAASMAHATQAAGEVMKYLGVN